MKKILVDGTYLGSAMKGVGHYLANTLREMGKTATRNEYNILVRAGEPLPPLPHDDRFQYIPIQLANHYRHGFWTLPHYANRLQVNLAWIPYETTLGNFACPYCVICHDVPQLITASQVQGGDAPGWARRWLAQADARLIQRSLRGAAYVFANSHFVARWLRDDLHIPQQRLEYAPCAPAANFAELSHDTDRAAMRRRLNSPEGYILVFATGDRRENFERVGRVFDCLVTQGAAAHPVSPINLVVAGVRNQAELKAQLKSYAWYEQVRWLPFFNQDQMAELAQVYAAASVYLDLSLHEGFGMQVIEAMACGTPVVCSNRGALPEVAGSAALLVNPADVDEITAALRQVLNNDACAEQLRSAGRARAATYNWASTTRTLLDTFERL